MKIKNLVKKLFLLSGLLIFCLGAFAQEKENIRIKVKINKDGEIKIDTVFSIDGDFDKSKLKKKLSELIDEDIDFNSLLKELYVDISIDEEGEFTDEESEYTIIVKSDDGKREIIKKKKPVIAKKGNIWVSKKSGKSKEGNYYIKKFDEEDEEVTIYMSGDKNLKKISEDVHIYGKTKDNFTIKKDDGKIIVTEGDFVWTTKEGDIHEIKGDKGDVYFFHDDGKNEVIKIEGEKKTFMKMKGGKDNSIVDLSYNEENGKYILEYNSESEAPFSIKIFDNEGELIFKKKVNDFTGKYKKELDLGSSKKKEFKIEIQQGKKKIETKIVF